MANIVKRNHRPHGTSVIQPHTKEDTITFITGQLQKLASNNLPQVEKISKIKSNGALDSTA
jgi:hypothetical protein